MATSGSSRDAFSGRPRFFLRVGYERFDVDEAANRSRWRVSLRVDNDDRVSYTFAHGNFPFQVNFNGSAWHAGNTPTGVFDFSDGAAYHNIGLWETGWINHDSVGTVRFSLEAAVANASIFGSATVPTFSVVQDHHRLPDAPGGRELQARTGTALTFGWAAADGNGSSILEYQGVLWDSSSLAGTAQVGAIKTGLDRSCTFTGLTRNTDYWFAARARTSVGWGPFTASLRATTAGVPNAPGTPSVDAYSDTAANISWSVPADNGSSIIGYDVQRATNSSFSGATTLLSNSTPSHHLSGLAKGTTYWVRVRAKNDAGDGPWSGARSFTTRDVPNTPSAPTISSYTQDDVTIAWTAPANNGYTITSYDIQYSRYSNFSSASTISGVTGSSRTISGLLLGTTYYFRIRATNASGDSDWSAGRSVTTRDVPSTPGAPTFDSRDVYSVDVNWTAPSDNGGYSVSGYQLQRSTSSDMSSPTTYTLGNTLGMAASSLAAGETYYWRVRAQNAAGYGPWSAIRSVTLLTGIPTAPTGLSLSGIGPKSQTLSWAAPSTGNGLSVTGYDVQFATNSSFSGATTVATNTTRSLTRNDLTPSTDYYWRVRAKTTEGAGPWSATVSEKTLSGGYAGVRGSYQPVEVRVGVGGSYEIAEVYVGADGVYVAAG